MAKTSDSDAPTLAEIESWLGRLIPPDQIVELRALGVREGGRTHAAISEKYPAGRYASMAARIVAWRGKAEGVYFVLNPTKPGAGKGSASDHHIARRIRLLVDVDPRREAKTSSTDDEKAAALGVALAIREFLRGMGFPEPALIDSGNGYHLLHAIDLPADDVFEFDEKGELTGRTDGPSTILVRDCLHALAARFNDEQVEVDTSVFNASRITKVPGSHVAKGRATAERPHRYARAIEIPEGWQAVPVAVDRLQALAELSPPQPTPQPTPQPEPEPQAGGDPWNLTAGKTKKLAKGGREWTPEERAIAYIAKRDPAISGQHGHDETFYTACCVGPGFNLPPDVALRVLLDHYNGRCQPPWSEAELRHKVEDAYAKNAHRMGWLLNAESKQRKGQTSSDGQLSGGGGSSRPGPDGGAREPGGFALTDLGNAERMVARHGRDLRHCHPFKRWLVWDGRRWALDETAAARRRARQTVRAIYGEAAADRDEDRRKALAKHAHDSEKRERISAMIHLAEAEAGMPILPFEMDPDPWAFNCWNGTLDLKTGQLRPHRREDLITKVCPHRFIPDARCPLWLSTLELFFAGNTDLIDYWQRLCGYALTGVIRDHVMPIPYGSGSNGKSTILGALLDAFGRDYAMKCPPDMLMAKKTDSHPTDRADLFGKRLVVAIETEQGRRLNETMVKELTGGDPIRARRMREDFWEFKPTHTLFLATNHKPAIRGTDNGIWRRLKLIPFTVSVDGERDDKKMPEKLQAEMPGILAWCVAGCLAWQERGLVAPASVQEATSAYRQDQDLIGAFLDQYTVPIPGARIKASVLFERYAKWAEAGRERTVLSQTEFGKVLAERGIESKKSGVMWYLDIGLREEGEDSDGDDSNKIPF